MSVSTFISKHIANKHAVKIEQALIDRYYQIEKKNKGNLPTAQKEWSPATEKRKRTDLFNTYNNRCPLRIVSIIMLLATAALLTTAFFFPPLFLILASSAGAAGGLSLITGGCALGSHIQYNKLLDQVVKQYIYHAQNTKGQITRFGDLEAQLKLGAQIAKKEIENVNNRNNSNNDTDQEDPTNTENEGTQQELPRPNTSPKRDNLLLRNRFSTASVKDWWVRNKPFSSKTNTN